jgi:hypothetical protein
MQGSGWYIDMHRTDHASSLKIKDMKLTRWCSGDAVRLYSGDSRF